MEILGSAEKILSEMIKRIPSMYQGEKPRAVVFLQHPETQEVDDGAVVTFSCSVDGSDPITYQWQKYNAVSGVWEDIAGEETAEHILTADIEENHNDLYRIRVENDFRVIYSLVASLFVVPVAAYIVTQPESQEVNDAETVTFTVVAEGTSPVTYQWQRKVGEDWVDISGAATDSYSFTASYLEHDEDIYRCVVSNSAGSEASNEVVLTVISDVNYLFLYNEGTGGNDFSADSVSGEPVIDAESLDYMLLELESWAENPATLTSFYFNYKELAPSDFRGYKQLGIVWEKTEEDTTTDSSVTLFIGEGGQTVLTLARAKEEWGVETNYIDLAGLSDTNLENCSVGAEFFNQGLEAQQYYKSVYKIHRIFLVPEDES